MYRSYYKLNKKPFDISPDPEFLWLGEKHREGLATLKYGIFSTWGCPYHTITAFILLLRGN
jgi:general secretion pathway protein A